MTDTPAGEAMSDELRIDLIRDVFDSVEKTTGLCMYTHSQVSRLFATIDALKAENERLRGDDEPICTGCGSTKSIAEIKATHPTAFSCCPERKMIPRKDARIAELEGIVGELEASLTSLQDVYFFTCRECENFLPDHTPDCIISRARKAVGG